MPEFEFYLLGAFFHAGLPVMQYFAPRMMIQISEFFVRFTHSIDDDVS